MINTDLNKNSWQPLTEIEEGIPQLKVCPAPQIIQSSQGIHPSQNLTTNRITAPPHEKKLARSQNIIYILCLFVIGAMFFKIYKAASDPHLANYAPILVEKYGPSFLEFDPEDPREKVLIMMTQNDNKKAFEPDFYDQLYPSLNEKFDVRFMHVDTITRLCKNLNAYGSFLNTVILSYHGTESLMGDWVIDDPVPTDCFKTLNQKVRFILDSCSTGSSKVSRSFAQYFASVSNRTVTAPTEVVYGKFIRDESTSEVVKWRFYGTYFSVFYQLIGRGYCQPTGKDITKIFYP